MAQEAEIQKLGFGSGRGSAWDFFSFWLKAMVETSLRNKYLLRQIQSYRPLCRTKPYNNQKTNAILIIV